MLRYPSTLSIVVPVLNEAETIGPLAKRINKAMVDYDIDYTIIFVDDDSTDNTWQAIKTIERKYPIIKLQKKGIRGKAESLLEGFESVRSPFTAILDGDLQYPPEDLPAMLDQIINDTCDIVVANRKNTEISPLRLFLSRGYRLVFAKLMWKLDVDVQSGMKLFKSEIIQQVSLKPKPWTFDLEFLVQARDAGYRIGSQDIFFSSREAGETKVKTLQTVFQIGTETIRLKLEQNNLIPFLNKTN